MRFFCWFHILIGVFSEMKENWLVLCTADFDETELIYLSEKLNSLECVQLIETMHNVIPMQSKYQDRNRKVSNDDVPTTRKNCLIELEEWNSKFPGNRSSQILMKDDGLELTEITNLSCISRILLKGNLRPGGRSTMESMLRSFGRPDLAKYVRENREPLKPYYSEVHDIGGTLEFPEHRILRRHAHKNDKHSSTKRKQKKRGQRRDSQNLTALNEVPSLHENQRTKKEDKDEVADTEENAHVNVSWTIFFVCFGLLLLTILLLVVLLIRRRCYMKRRATRLNEWMDKDNDEHCFDAHYGWRDRMDQRSCICSDTAAESGCPKTFFTFCKCYQKVDDQKQRAPSDVWNREQASSICVSATKKKKKKKRKRLKSILDRTQKDTKKEKDRKCRDGKCGRRKSCDRKKPCRGLT